MKNVSWIVTNANNLDDSKKHVLIDIFLYPYYIYGFLQKRLMNE